MPIREWCPRCAQGWVTYSRVAERTEPFWVCEECDGVWFGPSVSAIPESDLGTMFREIGHTTGLAGMNAVEH